MKEYKDEKEDLVYLEIKDRKINKEDFQRLRIIILKLAKIVRKEAKSGQSKIEVSANQISAAESANKELEKKIREKEKVFLFFIFKD